MSIEWNAVTWYSKTLAVALAVLIFAIGLYMGKQFGELQSARFTPAIRTAALIVPTTTSPQAAPIQKTDIAQATSTPAQKVILDTLVTKGPFVLNASGELFRKMPDGSLVALVTYEKDMKIDEFERPDFSSLYVQGKVRDFWPSPDGRYIAYEYISSLVGCCGSYPMVPIWDVRIMKSDGSGKQNPHASPFISLPIGNQHFAGWMKDSKSFLAYDYNPEEGISGSPFYIEYVDGSDPVIFKGMDYGASTIRSMSSNPRVTVISGEPHFSPTDDLMVYRKDGTLGREIILSRIDGTDKKYITFGDDFASSEIEWNSDGNTFTVYTTVGTTTSMTFDKNGNRLNQ